MIVESRVRNTKRNIFASYFNFAIQIIFQFISRTLIVYALGKEYLGIASLFTSILQILNMAEMGFSVAIVYNMYKPLALGDDKTVCALLAYYKNIYRRIGAVILAGGVILIPFLPYVIKGTPPRDLNIYVIYVLYLLNTSVSYFLFAYKTALLNALQRIDLIKISAAFINVCQYILQAVILLVYHNFYLFLVVSICGTVSVNVLNAYIAKKKFPQFEPGGNISKSLRLDIVNKIKGLLVCNISGVTYTTFDSIVLSSFLGLTSVAIYSNYIVVFNAATSFVEIIRSSAQASVGNSVAIESKRKNLNDIMLMQYVFSFIGTWSATVLICLYQPFMIFWMGENMLLPLADVILLGSWFLISTVQHAHYLYLSANGLWEKVKATYICSSIFNLFMNFLLGKYMGTTGVVLSSFLSVLLFGNIWQCLIVFKEYFNVSAKKYYLYQFLYLTIAIIVVGITYNLFVMIPLIGIGGLIFKTLVCSILSFILLLLSYRNFFLYNRAKDVFFMVISRRK